MNGLAAFREAVTLDFEFKALPGERPVPRACVAHELRSGRRFRLWEEDLRSPAPPFAHGPDVLFVAYFASAELGCYRVLGWPIPERILDPFVEFRMLTNGKTPPHGRSLLGALAYFRLDTTGASAEYKKAMQQSFGRGDYVEREAGLDYCESDVDALDRLLPALVPRIDLPRALLRGRYMAAVAAMEFHGVPIDTDTLAALREQWGPMQDALISSVDRDYHVFEGRTFKYERFESFLARARIPWPRHETGKLDLEDETFRNQAKAYPIISPLRELRSSLSDLRLESLTVGRDGRNRALLSPFRSKTGRNQPSNAEFIFGPSVWIRGLVKPPPGYGVAYVDWSQQEIGIVAKLSGDTALQDAYRAGDPYLSFGRQAGLIPPDGTKKTHGPQRELCKQCCLAINYGQTEYGLALRIEQPLIVARELMQAHKRTYRKYWAWSDAAVDSALLTGSIHTVFGWTLYTSEGNPNPRSLRNFPAQANAADLMRLAACLATERGLQICAPIHDAFLLAAPVDRLSADIESLRACMAEASRIVLAGFELGTDVTEVRWPDRYMDEDRGRLMWERVSELLRAKLERRVCA